jgi:plastocyanin
MIVAITVTAIVASGWLLLQKKSESTKEIQSQTSSKSGKVWVIKMVTKVSDDKVENVFAPDRIMIAPGDTVRWEVENGIHDTIAFHPGNEDHESDRHDDDHGQRPMRIPDGARPWQSEHLRTPGESFEYTFTTEGVYNYYCHPHQELGMVGLIVVGKPVPGPGLEPPQTELPEATQVKLTELIAWAKIQKGIR